MTATAVYSPRLKSLYREKYAKELMSELKLGNIHQIPRLQKIIVNVGLGRAKDERKIIEAAASTLRKITGQNPVETAAKASIAGFKLREGSKIGLKVTLRGDRMYEFADRVINLVLPRLRDFRGAASGSFDRQGNYSLGLADQSVFPELSYEDTTTSHGLQIVFVVGSQSPEHSRVLLEKLGLPFERPHGQTRRKDKE